MVSAGSAAKAASVKPAHSAAIAIVFRGSVGIVMVESYGRLDSRQRTPVPVRRAKVRLGAEKADRFDGCRPRFETWCRTPRRVCRWLVWKTFRPAPKRLRFHMG